MIRKAQQLNKGKLTFQLVCIFLAIAMRALGKGISLVHSENQTVTAEVLPKWLIISNNKMSFFVICHT